MLCRGASSFLSLLGLVFVHDDHFLHTPRLIIDFLKPLVHHKVPSMDFSKDFCTAKCGASFDEARRLLQVRAVLDHRLLSVVKPWASALPSDRCNHARVTRSASLRRKCCLCILYVQVHSVSQRTAAWIVLSSYRHCRCVSHVRP